MSFTKDDIDQVIQIVKLAKDIKQGEIHIDNGEIKLSVWTGEARDYAPSSGCLAAESAVAPPIPLDQEAIPSTVPAIAAQEEPKAVAVATKAEEKDETLEEGLIEIKASMISIFYRKPSPEDPPFVEIGSEVKKNTVVCLLEVMKCFRSINAGVNGRVEKICAETGQLVQEGELLFLVRPE